ncbi:hypothetical protein B0H13DRAFT_2300817 [Mycena leptocephala]|nr:hypothetical protein B0H13DRAFT_2300817 [Mycena leptocephala]
MIHRVNCPCSSELVETTSVLILGGIKCRLSVHTCTGGYKCEFFDPKLLQNYQRTDGADMTVTREVFSRELLQNQSDSSSAAGRAASFFRVTQGYKKRGCRKSGCGGGPVSGASQLSL